MTIDRCTIHPTATIRDPENSYLNRATIGAHTIVEPSTSIAGAKVGDYCHVERGSIIEGLPDVLGNRVPDGSVLSSSVATPAELEAAQAAGALFTSTVMWTPDNGVWVKPGCLPWEPIEVTRDRIRSALREGHCTRIGCFEPGNRRFEAFTRRMNFWQDKLVEWDRQTTTWAKDAA